MTDKANAGLPGVTVQVKGSNMGTVTDANGQYTLQAEETGTLVFSSIGFTRQEIAIGSRSVIDVILLDDSKSLDEVVVVGYGTQRKSDVTGARVTIKGDELVKQPVLTATQALQGKAAGVQIISSGQPGSAPVIRVRGTGTALAGTAALFVVDGVLTDDITNINTADIVNVDVLKDASATAIYGARGANGVVIITTKRGTDFQTVKGGGKWIHYVMVYDGTGSNIDLYANNVLVSNKNFRNRTTGTPAVGIGPITMATPTQVLIGGWPNADTGYTKSAVQAFQALFVGGIDEVRVYNKVLTPAEIGSLYQLESANR